ncbi:MAG: hypothetical protein M2R45_03584 [Verrucomicrobia subdivision 3 bacterium]|nr:hypothetical protein [Limisphaerales bacterium]MCS1414783.1 hypothetical protein [Limisphaerales bacterium]
MITEMEMEGFEALVLQLKRVSEKKEITRNKLHLKECDDYMQQMGYKDKSYEGIDLARWIDTEALYHRIENFYYRKRRFFEFDTDVRHSVYDQLEQLFLDAHKHYAKVFREYQKMFQEHNYKKQVAHNPMLEKILDASQKPKTPKNQPPSRSNKIGMRVITYLLKMLARICRHQTIEEAVEKFFLEKDKQNEESIAAPLGESID